ncbi:GntR family transcriptional regulator [Tsukamurella sputi]|uniref:GntR family transcriptional regulator n=1 Tax=Tsukamurella sputi TaxID=2591848 RepID=A0A5C5RI18_9ACTN|nr:GntR family transcriptional regulator [Tsukamurella sputi]TWS22378.1 GntR family transcriptional regulator [Tsukamurella sputi]
MYTVVASALRDDILGHRYRIGESLPSEAALCEKFGVSRGPVRQALSTLNREGLIHITRGRPAVVTSNAPSQTLDVFTPFSQWAQLGGQAPSSRTVEITRRRATVAEAETLGLTTDDFVVFILRLRMIDDAPAMLERSTFVLDVGRLLLDFDTDSGSLTEHLTENGVVFESMRHQLDALNADATDAEHLAVEPGAALLRERRVSTNEDGRPFEFADDRYRPDRVTFSIVNSTRR